MGSSSLSRCRRGRHRRGARGKLTEACPVDIFAQADGGSLELVERNLDECVLCGLCLAAAPEGTVTIIKLYDDEAALAAV